MGKFSLQDPGSVSAFRGFPDSSSGIVENSLSRAIAHPNPEVPFDNQQGELASLQPVVEVLTTFLRPGLNRTAPALGDN
jgi:hypothetical protein